MVYTLKKYLTELKTNPYWEVEPHFHYYCQRYFLKYFKTVVENKMSPKDFQSAMYGEFVILGKPILNGFIKDLNFMVKLTRKILDGCS